MIGQQDASTGTAELTCAAATTVAVNYVIAGLSYDETTGIEQIKADFTEAVRAVYAQAKTEGVLRYNDVRPLSFCNRRSRGL